MAAPAFDAATTYNVRDFTGITAAFLHTCGGSANYLKVVVSTSTGVPSSVTGITYNSVAMTKLGSEVPTPDGFTKLSYWYLFNPTTGSNLVAITTDHTGDDHIAVVAVSYSGVDVAGTPHGTAHTDTGTGSTISNTVASASGELVVDGVTSTDSDFSSCGQTSRGHVADGSPDNWCGASEASGSATVNMTWGITGSFAWASIGVSLKGTGGSSDTLMAQVCT